MLKFFSYNVFCFLLLPIIVVIYMSFNSNAYFMLGNDLSIQWYKELFTTPIWISTFKNSILIGTFSTLISLLIGIPAALWLRFNSKYESVIMSLILSPMIIPPIIAAVGWFFFYSSLNMNNSMINMVLSHTILSIPFVVISVLTSLKQYNLSLTKSSLLCGANQFETFIYVTFPQIKLGIFTGALLSFMNSFDEFIVSMFLSNHNTRTVPLQLWSSMRENISPVVLAIASILIVVSFIFLLLLSNNKYFKGANVE